MLPNKFGLEKSSCTICNKKFNGMFVSEHQCKRCLRLVCKQCCNKKKNIFTNNLANHFNQKIGIIKAEEHRACDQCHLASDNIQKIIHMYSLNFGNLSKIGHQWFELIQMNQDIIEKGEETKIKNVESGKSSNLLPDLWVKSSPSFRQLFGTLMMKRNLSEINQKMDLIRVKANVGDNEMLLAAYFSCFCDSKSAIIAIRFLKNILPKFNTDMVNEYLNLLINNQKNFNDKVQIKSLLNFGDKFSCSLFFVAEAYLPILPVECIQQLMHQIFLSGSPTILELVCSFLLFEYRQVILDSKINDENIRLLIRDTITGSMVEKGIKNLRNLIIKNNKKQQSKKAQSLLVPEKDQEQISKEEDDVLKKIDQASQFIRKIEENQLNDEDVDPTQMVNLEQYLDMIISQNQQALSQYDQVDEMLTTIEEKLYKINRQ